MSERQAFVAVVQDADGNEETEVVTIEQDGDRPPVIELTNGMRISCVSTTAEAT